MHGTDDELVWVKSTFTDSGSCVEWARPAGGVLVRDSKRPAGARIPLQPAAWSALVDWAKTHQV
ncbi:hypothetical protein J3A78_002123 [Streptomyces sp. PvR006]|uniref:DUF397 domain-containing protein n=1 Tax=Streptomyces sp. PvR006 TaxID=2817860 RepID=UPI001AE43919|nr:DUF397 domain-containing protein [Streptomyces sp. PvR006]MBP2581645.1 hypothetical protein [Streptomyces sp. PvR006]